MQWLDYLIPILIFVFWIIGQFSSSDEEKEQKKQRKKNGSPAPDMDDESEPIDIEEMLRREIAGKRQQTKETKTTQEPNQPQKASSPPASGTNQQNKQKTKKKTSQTVPASNKRSANPANPHQDEIARYQKQAKEARSKYEKAREDSLSASQKTRHAAGMHHSPSAGSGNLRKQVIHGLYQPDTLKKAFLYQEILGPPVAMREPGSWYAAWKQQ